MLLELAALAVPLLILVHPLDVDDGVVAVGVKPAVAPLAYDYVVLVEPALAYGAYVVLESIVLFLNEFFLL